jgi:anti-anti-sigma regulatory factor
MVMPFAGPEPAMQTVEMLRQDDASHGVRVVVLDLGGSVLDDDLGAAALERVVDEIQSWNTEVILTGVSPLSEEIVAELQASHMLTRKDLGEAVAYAFQIADAQRRLL